jgi:hypothetical protein
LSANFEEEIRDNKQCQFCAIKARMTAAESLPGCAGGSYLNWNRLSRIALEMVLNMVARGKTAARLNCRTACHMLEKIAVNA